MGRRITLEIGSKHGRLTVLEDLGSMKPNDSYVQAFSMCRVRCDCGAEFDAMQSLVHRGQVKSCGCLKRDVAKNRAPRGTHPPLSRDMKDKMNAWQRKFRQTEAGRYLVRKMNLKRFGITPEQYDDLVKRQKGLCASCGRPETKKSNGIGIIRLAVDHCHKSSMIRGLLCMKCNRALGLLDDDPHIIEALLKYRMRSL